MCTYLGGVLLYFISYIRTKTHETRNEALRIKKKEKSPSSISITYIYNEGLKTNTFKVIWNFNNNVYNRCFRRGMLYIFYK